MNEARCTEDGIVYDAMNFSRQYPNDLGWKRRLLQCPECGAPAFFRNASPNGRVPCFGARPHVLGCNLAAYDHERYGRNVGDQERVEARSGGKIVVDLRYGAPENRFDGNPVSNFLAPTHSGGTGGRGFQPNAPTSCRPQSLLRSLVSSPDFCMSDWPLEVHGLSGISVRDFFIPLPAVTAQYDGQLRGFWGMLTDVREDFRGTLWLNGGGRNNISFCLDARFLDQLHSRFRINSYEDLAGAYILVVGKLRASYSKEIYCVIDELECMALQFE